MAINSASDDPESVCEAMLQFERELGSLDTFETALEKCSAQMKRIKERREIVSHFTLCCCKVLFDPCGLSNISFLKSTNISSLEAPLF